MIATRSRDRARVAVNVCAYAVYLLLLKIVFFFQGTNPKAVPFIYGLAIIKYRNLHVYAYISPFMLTNPENVRKIKMKMHYTYT